MRRTDPEGHGPVRYGPPLPGDGLPVLPELAAVVAAAAPTPRPVHPAAARVPAADHTGGSGPPAPPAAPPRAPRGLAAPPGVPADEHVPEAAPQARPAAVRHP
ncbi:hypothetical protein FRZ03_01920 [Streptomyces misionensis]|uniref:Uncharacterized protein n=1 Tax=Streptomyces misionensis TaxID=67331 RepID=A0A5C6K781_9ACTN|nr:hypothetical protein [Streptomyces misionensis]TWV57538.1 hypothetical protein FRZ03_01920 [Streptomyces misionensis]